MSENDKSNKRCPATKRNLLAQLPLILTMQQASISLTEMYSLCYMYCNHTEKPRSVKQCLQQQLHLYMYSAIFMRWRNILSSIFNALQHSWSMLDNASIKCLTRIRSEWVLQLDCNTELMEYDALIRQLLNPKTVLNIMCFSFSL